MGNREEYNTCMRPYMTGSKPKEQRKLDFCVGAKVCSGKAKTEEEAKAICSIPKLPKWAKEILPKEEPITCQLRDKRAIEAMQDFNDISKRPYMTGETKDLKNKFDMVKAIL